VTASWGKLGRAQRDRACRKSVQGRRGPLPHPAGHSVLWDLAWR